MSDSENNLRKQNIQTVRNFYDYLVNDNTESMPKIWADEAVFYTVGHHQLIRSL